MSMTNMSIRTDKQVKERAELLFESLGINMTTAVNMFLRQALRVNGLPFEVKADVPNEVTLAAFEEGARILADQNAVGYHSMEDLREALEV